MLRLLSLRLEASFTIHYAQSFRKKLPLDYKKGNKHDHKNTHAIPLLVKDRLLKVNSISIQSHKGGNWKKIRELERNSLKPFGHFTKAGNFLLSSGFVFDKEKLPFYDIPDLQGF